MSIKKLNTFCEKFFANAETRINERGNTIYERFFDSERYGIDFADDFKEAGWEQFDTDQDAAYFGVWINASKRWTLTYCEGDWSLIKCETSDQYKAEIQSLIGFYGEGRIALAISTDGTATEYRQDRSLFLQEA